MTDITISTGQGQTNRGTQELISLSDLSEAAGHSVFDTHGDYASSFTPLGVDGHICSATQDGRAVDPTLIGDLRELWRQRVDLHRAEKSLTLQIKAKCRRVMEGDKKEGEKMYTSMLNGQKMSGATEVRMASEPFINARAIINAERAQTEKLLAKLAKQLPVWPWVESVRGFGALSLAGIIGEAGDLSMYANPAKLWKRMGLAVMADGRQRRVTGGDAIEHGYCPHRRSLIWNIGETIVKGTIRKVKDDAGEDTGERTALNEYGQIYLDRKSYETDRVETAAHAHNRAKRYMEKRLLRNLWREWRATA